MGKEEYKQGTGKELISDYELVKGWVYMITADEARTLSNIAVNYYSSDTLKDIEALIKKYTQRGLYAMFYKGTLSDMDISVLLNNGYKLQIGINKEPTLIWWNKGKILG